MIIKRGGWCGIISKIVYLKAVSHSQRDRWEALFRPLWILEINTDEIYLHVENKCYKKHEHKAAEQNMVIPTSR